MEIKSSLTHSLDKSGIYQILNKITNKSYIGSTSQTIYKRIHHHLCMLRKGTHKNSHLQHTWDKYGEDNFTFIILDNVEKEHVLAKEQEYIDLFGIENLYNINSFATGTNQFSKETLEKRGKSFQKTTSTASEYYYKVKEGLIELKDVPSKYFKLVEFRLNTTIWNKGKTKENGQDYSFLKGVSKTMSDKRIQARKKIKENRRNNVFPEIYVYDDTYTFLGKYRSSIDLYEASLKDDFELNDFMKLRNPTGRNGYSPFILKSFNIAKSCRDKTKYKGLYFLTEPLHQVIDVEKQGELSESLVADNTEPSQI